MADRDAAPGSGPGDLVVGVGDHEISLRVVGGGSWRLPVGVIDLLDGPLERADLPQPEQLTNALGVVTDHLDDVLRESPVVEAAPRVVVAGPHADALARVEVGRDPVDGDHELARPDADEVFRTLVAEPVAERRHNPGLRADEAETIVATCCVVLALMRRLELTSVTVVAEAA